MAGQLKGDLTPAQAEELVWLTLKRLEKANLLETEVVKSAGRKVYTRREILVRLGVAAALLPVEAQSPQPITQIVLYDAGVIADGNLGGRAGADAICAASPNRPTGYTNFRAFISVDTNDEIRDMPTNYGVPTNLPIVGQNGTQLAPNWSGLLDGGIDASLAAAGSGGLSLSQRWWSGSDAAGQVTADTCVGWTSAAALDHGNNGMNGFVNTLWITETPAGSCDQRGTGHDVKCLAY